MRYIRTKNGKIYEIKGRERTPYGDYIASKGERIGFDLVLKEADTVEGLFDGFVVTVPAIKHMYVKHSLKEALQKQEWLEEGGYASAIYGAIRTDDKRLVRVAKMKDVLPNGEVDWELLSEQQQAKGAGPMERRRIIFLLHCYTDGDWYFKKEPKGPNLDDLTNPCFVSDYKDWRVGVDEFGDSYEYCFAFDLAEYQIPRLIRFLEDLKKDLHYVEGHDWIRTEMDSMIDPAIGFLESKKEGTHFGTICNGNWQPTALTINIRTV